MSMEVRDMKITEKIVDIETGKERVIERDASTEEIAAIEESKERLAAQQAEAAKVKAAKTALLEKLGISEDEAKLLLS